LGVETGRASTDKDYKLGNGAIIELANGEKIHDSNPGRPNATFDPFVLAILRQIGVALEVPFEILIKHYTASYSAARAAINEMWKFVMSERQHLADNFLRLVYEVWMWEAVASGRLDAPGYFSDPLIRAAYLGSDWVGQAKGQIQESDEVDAAAKRVEYGFSTLQQETVQLTGGDWEQNHPQQVKERKKRLEDGLIDPTQQTKGEKNGQRNKSIGS
jgi:capsid protein